MANNWCKNVVLLYEVNLVSGCRTVIRVFSSIKSAKVYRSNKYGLYAVRKSINLNDIYPIEKWGVTFASEV